MSPAPSAVKFVNYLEVYHQLTAVLSKLWPVGDNETRLLVLDRCAGMKDEDPLSLPRHFGFYQRIPEPIAG
jgi:hypothetical protein